MACLQSLALGILWLWFCIRVGLLVMLFVPFDSASMKDFEHGQAKRGYGYGKQSADDAKEMLASHQGENHQSGMNFGGIADNLGIQEVGFNQMNAHNPTQGGKTSVDASGQSNGYDRDRRNNRTSRSSCFCQRPPSDRPFSRPVIAFIPACRWRIMS